MLPLRTTDHSRQWPVWLLVLAWFCAHCPQTLICTSLVWLGEARSFTHQQRLTTDVAHLLGGEKTPSHLASLGKTPFSPAKPVLPPLPELKKIELAALDTLVRLTPSSPPSDPIRLELSLHGILRAPPPHGPPRAGLTT